MRNREENKKKVEQKRSNIKSHLSHIRKAKLLDAIFSHYFFKKPEYVSSENQVFGIFIEHKISIQWNIKWSTRDDVQNQKDDEGLNGIGDSKKNANAI